MNIAFKPTIPKCFGIKPKSPSPDALRIYNSWSSKELNTLVLLKAIGMPYRDIGRLLHRSKDSCSIVMSRHDLRSEYKKVRECLVQEILEYAA